MEVQELLTVEDMTRLLKVDRDTIYKEIKNDKMAVTKIGGQWRITVENFQAYIKSRTRKIKSQLS